MKSVSESANKVVNVVLLSAVNAPTKDVKLGLATAWSTIFGSPITASTICTTPFIALLSAAVSVEVPFKTTPSSVFMNMLRFASFAPAVESVET